MKKSLTLTTLFALVLLTYIFLQSPFATAVSAKKEDEDHHHHHKKPTPTSLPTTTPTATPTTIPVVSPTLVPTVMPTVAPTIIPTIAPTSTPIPCNIVPAGSTISDQSQSVYNGGLSQPHYAGYKVWQSFTAGQSGTLNQLTVGFFNTLNGQATLKIYDGEGNTGALLSSQVVNISCSSQAGGCLIPFNINVPVNQAGKYTFELGDWINMPLIIGIQIQNPGGYSGGYAATVYPNGASVTEPFDLVFGTNIQISKEICL